MCVAVIEIQAQEEAIKHRRQVEEDTYLGEILCKITPLKPADIAEALALEQFLDLG